MFSSLFAYKCYICLVEQRKHFPLKYLAKKHLAIQLQFFKARLNVQMITCEVAYLYPGKLIENFQSFCNCPIDQNNSAGEKEEIYG